MVQIALLKKLKPFEAKIDELIDGLDGFSMLVDLTDSRPPNASVRKTLREVFAAINQKGLHKAAAFTGKNFLINAAAKFVLGGADLNFSVHKTIEDAESEIEGPN